MANRHANKKLRLLTRARMAVTRESYQRALSQVMAEYAARRAAPAPAESFDLIECSYYGVPMTLAMIQDSRFPRMVVLPRFELPHVERSQGGPLVWMRFLPPRGVQ